MKLLVKLAKCIVNHYDEKKGKAVIDVPYVVNKKVERMVNEGTLVETVEKAVEESVNRAIEDTITSYNIRSTLEEKFEAEISQSLGTLSFKEYGEKVVNNILDIVEKQTDVDFREKIEKAYASFFNTDCSDIDGEVLAGAYAEYLNSKLEYDDKVEVEGRYHCKVELDNTPGWVTMSFMISENDNYDKHNYVVYLHRCSEEKDKDANEEQYYRVSFMGSSSEHANLFKAFAYKEYMYTAFEKLLINCYLNERRIKLEPGEYECYADIDY